MSLAPDWSFCTESIRVVLGGVVIDADNPTDDDDVVLTDPGEQVPVVADTLGELLALLLVLVMMGLLWR